MKYPLRWRMKAAAKAFLYGLWCSFCAAVNILFGLRPDVAGADIRLIDRNGNTIDPAPKPEPAPQAVPEPVVHPLPKQYLDGREVVGSVIVPGEPFYSEYIHQLMETPGKKVKIHKGHHYVLTAKGTWFRLDPIRGDSEDKQDEFEGGGPDL